MAEDWDFRVGNEICEVRAAGILVRDDKILLDHNLKADEYLLPGGAVKIGEVSRDALIREFYEEFDTEIKIKNLVSVSEFSNDFQDCRINIVQFEYEISVENLKIDFDKSEPNVEKVWIQLKDLSNLTLVPKELRGRLDALRRN